MNKQKLLELLDSVIPDDARFTKLEVGMLLNFDGKEHVYRRLSSRASDEELKHAAVLFNDDLTSEDLSFRLSVR